MKVQLQEYLFGTMRMNLFPMMTGVVVVGREVNGGVGCAVVKAEGDIGIEIEDAGIGVMVREGIGGLTDSVTE